MELRGLDHGWRRGGEGWNWKGGDGMKGERERNAGGGGRMEEEEEEEKEENMEKGG